MIASAPPILPPELPSTDQLCKLIVATALPSLISQNKSQGTIKLSGADIVLVESKHKAAEYYVRQSIVDQLRQHASEIRAFLEYQLYHTNDSTTLEPITRAFSLFDIFQNTRHTEKFASGAFGVGRLKISLPIFVEEDDFDENETEIPIINEPSVTEAKPAHVSAELIGGVSSSKQEGGIESLEGILPQNEAAKRVIEQFKTLEGLGYKITVHNRESHILIKTFSDPDSSQATGQTFVSGVTGEITSQY